MNPILDTITMIIRIITCIPLLLFVINQFGNDDKKIETHEVKMVRKVTVLLAISVVTLIIQVLIFRVLMNLDMFQWNGLNSLISLVVSTIVCYASWRAYQEFKQINK